MSTRTDALLALAGGAIGGAAAITGLWLSRRLLAQDITAAKPYDQAGAITTSLTNLRGARPWTGR